MSVFHVPCVPASADARATQTLERLCGQVDALRTRPLAGEDFERVERELHERFRRRRGRLQDAGHSTTEALRNAMAPWWWTGRLDAPCPDAKFTLRPSVDLAVQYLSSKRQGPGQRGGVSSSTCRVTNQYESYTPPERGWVHSGRTAVSVVSSACGASSLPPSCARKQRTLSTIMRRSE